MELTLRVLKMKTRAIESNQGRRQKSTERQGEEWNQQCIHNEDIFGSGDTKRNVQTKASSGRVDRNGAIGGLTKKIPAFLRYVFPDR